MLATVLSCDNFDEKEISSYLTLIYQSSVRDITSMNAILSQLIISCLVYIGLSEGLANEVSILGVTVVFKAFYSCLFLIFYSYLLSDLVRLVLHVRELRYMHAHLVSHLREPHKIRLLDDKLISPQAGRYEEFNQLLFNRKNIASGLLFGLTYVGLMVFFFLLCNQVFHFNPDHKVELNLTLKFLSLAVAGLMTIGTGINIYNHIKLLKK